MLMWMEVEMNCDRLQDCVGSCRNRAVIVFLSRLCLRLCPLVFFVIFCAYCLVLRYICVTLLIMGDTCICLDEICAGVAWE